jgi:hypothetical protein
MIDQDYENLYDRIGLQHACELAKQRHRLNVIWGAVSAVLAIVAFFAGIVLGAVVVLK